MEPLLIDVRSTEEYAGGFLDGAVNIPYTEIHDLHQVFPDIQLDSTISLYCQSGRRTAIAETTLREMGFTNIRDLGGIQQASEILAGGVLPSEAGDIPLFVDHTASGKTVVAPKAHGSQPYSKQYLQSTTDELMAAMRALEGSDST